MSAVDLAAVIVTVVCLATVVVLTIAVVSLVRTMRELRDVVDDLRDSALPMVDDLRTTVTKADAELHRVDRVIGRAERISATVDHASRLTYRAFAPPLIKGLSRWCRARARPVGACVSAVATAGPWMWPRPTALPPPTRPQPPCR